jgi:hypothetical protein
MLRKLSLSTAVAACLFIPTSVFAGGHPGGGGRPGGAGHAVVGGGAGFHRGGVVVGGGGGGGRHFWHGRWYGYGVGPCWAVSPVGYVWICG